MFVLRLFRSKCCFSGMFGGGPIFSLPSAPLTTRRDVTTCCCTRPLRPGGSCRFRSVFPAADVVPVVDVMPTLLPDAAMYAPLAR